MIHQRKIDAGAVFDPAADLELARAFLHAHGTALAAVAHMLGGAAASGRVFLLIETLRDACRLTRSQHRHLVDLYRLLSLENVGDPERIETAMFAAIDPASPIVEEICRLAEALEALLHQISADEGAGDVNAAKVLGKAA